MSTLSANREKSQEMGCETGPTHPLERPLALVVQADANRPQGVSKVTCFLDLIDEAIAGIEAERKEGQGYTPGTLRNDYRHSNNALTVSMLTLDLDARNGAPLVLEDVDAVANDLTTRGVAFYMTPTWHCLQPTAAKSGERRRLCVAVSRDVLADEWPAFWARAVEHLGLADLADQSCKDTGRFYFDPRYPEPLRTAYRSRVRFNFENATPLDVDTVLALPGPAPKKAKPVPANHATDDSDRSADIDAMTALLRPHWTDGKRNALRLWGSAMLKHAGWTQRDAETLFVERLAPKDGAAAKALDAVRGSYETDRAAGFKNFAETLGDVSLAESVRSIAYRTNREHEREQNAGFNALVAEHEAAANDTVAPVPAPKAPVKATAFVDIFAPQPAVPWVVRGIDLAPGPPTIVAGAGFSGKTVACQSLALSLAAGRLVWGAYDVPRGGSSVLHLDYEQGARLTATRYQRLARGMGLWAPEVADRLALVVAPDFYLDQPGAETRLVELVTGRTLVIIDSLRAACPTVDENSSDARRPLDMLFRVSERTGAAFVVIHHAGKNPQDKVLARPQLEPVRAVA